jgi:hypothetical protein
MRERQDLFYIIFNIMLKTALISVIGFIAVTQSAPVLPKWMRASGYGSANIYTYDYETQGATPQYAGYSYMSWDFNANCVHTYQNDLTNWAEMVLCNN